MGDANGGSVDRDAAADGYASSAPFGSHAPVATTPITPVTVTTAAIATPRSRINRQSEEEVLACLRRGEVVEALTILMNAYGSLIQGFIFRMVRNHDTAEDLRQQVFLEAFRGIADFKRRSSCYTWLTSIAYHRCLDTLKRDRRIKTTDDFDVLNALHWQPDPAMDSGLEAKRRALEHCLGKIPQAMRAELLMRLYFDLSYAEIEKISGASAGTIQMRVMRLLPKLRRCLHAKGVTG